ncbi:uncharacterized protein LOC124816608 isoform X1 [Hydra vulgaris]|uniref:uncharacterized protein LOC124816608 isoform X1 n=1 Tax=Hydra vulgaris TaxID=6087 RepID=UPI001F5ED003|nr:uncharacterized protein LOC124816608 [Hydra vulgaris]
MTKLWLNILYYCATFIHVNLFITRLPCILYESFNLTPNKYYYGLINSTLKASSSNDCGTYCVRNPFCIFANYNDNQKICQLISTNVDLLNIRDDSLWEVLATDSSSNKNKGPLCETNTPCGERYCRDVCSITNLDLQHTYNCIDTTDVSRIATPSLSSLYLKSDEWSASKVIDGNPSTFAATDFKVSPQWIKLDLKFVYQITQIDILNRGGSCCIERLKGAKLNVKLTDTTVDNYEISTLTANLKQTFVGSFVARFVVVTKSIDLLLHLAEINVFV